MLSSFEIDAIDDRARLDAVLMESSFPLAHRLVETLDPSVVAEGRAGFEAATPGARGLVALGRPGAWIATAALLDALPRQRAMPWPPFERWDAVIAIQVEPPETAWLVAEVFAALGPSQQALARRLVYGVERRFGPRGWRVLAARGAGGPHGSLLPPMVRV